MKSAIKKLLPVVVSIVIIYMVFKGIDFKKTVEAFQSFNIKYLLLLAPLYYLTFVIRAFRWKTLLLEKATLKIKDLFSFLFIGYMFNCFFPARAGDFYRAHLLGTNQKTEKAKAFASIVLERIFDGIIVLFLLTLSVLSFLREKWLFNIITTAGGVFIGAFLTMYILSKHVNTTESENKSEILQKKLPNFVAKPLAFVVDFFNKNLRSFIEGLDVFKHPSLMTKIILQTTCIWLIETTIVFFFLKSYGISIPFFSSLFVLGLLVFSALIPSMSVFTGPYQYAYIKSLAVFGVADEKSLAIAFTNQLMIMILMTTAGLIAYFRYNLNSKKESITKNS